MKQPTNVISKLASHLLGWQGGQPVLFPTKDVVQSVTDPLTGGLKSVKAGALAITPFSLAGEITVQTRDLQGRVTTFWMSDVGHTVTYGPHGVASVTASGVTTTFNYSTSGLLLGSTQS